MHGINRLWKSKSLWKSVAMLFRTGRKFMYFWVLCALSLSSRMVSWRSIQCVQVSSLALASFPGRMGGEKTSSLLPRGLGTRLHRHWFNLKMLESFSQLYSQFLHWQWNRSGRLSYRQTNVCSMVPEIELAKLSAILSQPWAWDNELRMCSD